jgi:alkylation response protein AidB-like acyl-CoA dehydrogenase
MDFGAVNLDENATALLARVREVLDEVLGNSDDWPVRDRESIPSNLHRALGDEGFIAPRWSVLDGGADAGALGDRLISEELARRQIYISHTPVMLAQTVNRYLRDELLRQGIVRGIAAGQVRICLGYSEPDGGSDIANVRTRAVRDGDEWVINGAKVFTSVAHLSQYIFLLTRTNIDVPKHRGLTMFIVPLDLPGFELQPLITIGHDRLNVVYMRDVRVSDEYRLGDVDSGWAILQDPLNTEHGVGDLNEAGLGDIHGQGMLSTVPASLMLGRIIRWGARRDPRTGQAPLDQPLIAAAIANAAVDLEVARNSSGVMSKVAASEAYARMAADLIEAAGIAGLVSQGHEDALEGGVLDWAHRRSQATTIAGGTTEVFKNILAESALGLPRQLPVARRSG